MVLPDVDVLIYAHRAGLSQHEATRAWLDAAIGTNASYGLSELVLSSFLRIVTSAFVDPTPLDLAMETRMRGAVGAAACS